MKSNDRFAISVLVVAVTLSTIGRATAAELTDAQTRPGAVGAEPSAQVAAHATRADPERVLGIGGLFFRARDPEALAAWYSMHLGVSPTPTDYEQQPWVQQAGPTVFAPFPSNTEYFGRPAQAWMINFRVRSLSAMVEQLRAAGIAVEVDAETYPNGRFARLEDPEGNPIQLWEPGGVAAPASGP